jgi:hypothetical protein
MIRCMRSWCWRIKATDTHLEYVIQLLSNFNNRQTNTSQCYVTRTLHVLPSLPSNKRTVAQSFYLPCYRLHKPGVVVQLSYGRQIYLLDEFKAASGAQPASYTKPKGSWGGVGIFVRCELVIQPRYEPEHRLSFPRLRMSGAVTPSPTCLHAVYRDNITFSFNSRE